MLLRKLTFSLVLISVFAYSDTVVLSNGDTLGGKVISKSETQLTLEHSVLGSMILARDKIKSVSYTEPVAAKATLTVTPEILSEKFHISSEVNSAETLKPVIDTPFFSAWETQLELGLGGSEGNSQSRNIHAALQAKQEAPELRRELAMAYDADEKNNEKSRNEFYTSVNQDWLINESPWFYFALGRFDQDDFQDWDYRFNVSSGAGYDFVNRDEWTLRGRAGLGGNREFGGKDREINIEALLEAASQWTLSPHHKIELRTTFYPQLDELSQFRNITSLNWINKLNGSMRMKIGLSSEHDSDVPEGIKRNDFKYTTSLSWDL